jgi:hypothetical protein
MAFVKPFMHSIRLVLGLQNRETDPPGFSSASVEEPDVLIY